MACSPETREKIEELEEKVLPSLGRRQKRIFMNAVAQVLGEEDGGPPAVSSGERRRRPGGGRKSAAQKIPDLYAKIRTIIDGENDDVVLSFTTLSLRAIAERLNEQYGIRVSQNIVSRALDSLGYRKQEKTRNHSQGKTQADAAMQFSYIDTQAKAFLKEDTPIVFLRRQTKGEERKKERSSYPLQASDPELVFALGILVWWRMAGQAQFPKAADLYAVLDTGRQEITGKLPVYLQAVALCTHLTIHISRLPQGTAKWEHETGSLTLVPSEGNPVLVSLIAKRHGEMAAPGTGEESALEGDLARVQADLQRGEKVPEFRKEDLWNAVVTAGGREKEKTETAEHIGRALAKEDEHG